jgi:hypothetical protein
VEGHSWGQQVSDQRFVTLDLDKGMMRLEDAHWSFRRQARDGQEEQGRVITRLCQDS